MLVSWTKINEKKRVRKKIRGSERYKREREREKDTHTHTHTHTRTHTQTQRYADTSILMAT